jgi:hypothetical protein
MRRSIGHLLCCLCVLASSHSSATSDSAAPVVTSPEHVRRPEQTFLTFPEWYLVHSPAEYAAFLAHADHPSRFPLYSHIGQFWQSYAAVNHEIARYPFNGGYHAMVMVIGTSTTVEYGLKGLYEHTVGRLAEATKSAGQVPEEIFAAKFAQAYVDFIRVDPWYKFNFWSELESLWTKVPLTGSNMIRKWERRFALTTELLVKEGYARLIKLGTQSLYDAPKPVTAVVLSRAPTDGLSEHQDFAVHGQPRGDGVVLATVPRYEGFTAYSRWLAAQGLDFVEIAGNKSDVVVSMLVPDGWTPAGARVLFEQPILTRPGTKRVVLAMPVARLAAELRREDSLGTQVSIEHVYDF